jgi:trans-2,3-dihydro-3-hydroxyanthranilate isomerase
VKTLRFVTLDAFTTTPFAGNPCAVITQADGLSDAQMQQIARETNQPESAFILSSQKANFRVRYFTPHQEVPFAGHPTIATSFLIALEKMAPMTGDRAVLMMEFQIGVLPVEISLKNGAPVEAIMSQQPPVFGPQCSVAETAASLGLAEADLRAEAPVQVVSTGSPFLMALVKNVDVLGRIAVNREKLMDLLKRAGVNAIFVFSTGGFDPAADTHARMFDPFTGHEDPYTGSAAGGMGAYLVHYGVKLGPSLVAEQGHFVGRPGTGRLEIAQLDGKIRQVRLAGSAVKVMEGQIYLPE